MPMAGAGTTHDPVQAKYADDIEAAGFKWEAFAFGAEPVCLCWSNVGAGGDATLTAQADVVRIPDNLDANLTAGQVTAVSNWLEARNFPAGWLDTSFTVRAALRIVLGAFQFWDAYTVQAAGARLFGGSVTLATRFNQLPAANRTALVNAANALGLDTSGLSGTNTLRVMLKAMADQWGARPIYWMHAGQLV